MYVPVVVFIVIFVLLTVFMMAVSFHVFRFRYPKDSSGIVFGALATVFILIAIMTFLLFHYSDGASATINTLNNL